MPLRWVSIDPGDRHVGWAEWTLGNCIKAEEITPEECDNRLYARCVHEHDLDHIVYEKFALYAWNERSLSGNEFETSQLIGVIKSHARRGDVPASGQFASQHKAIYRMGWYKELTPKELREMPWWGHGGHAKDAWVVGAWFKRQRQKE